MTMMTVERLHQLFEDNEDKELLSWEGTCHDCKTDMAVSAIPQEEGIHIKGGGIYETEPGKFLLKCDDCFGKDSTLRNFQSCEVYSRVVGYLRPVAQWNDAKQAEFKDRKLFNVSIG